MGWVLYGHAVLWAGAAVGFSNVRTEAPRAGSNLVQAPKRFGAGSDLVQGNLPCMAIKFHSSWGTVLLSGLAWVLSPAF